MKKRGRSPGDSSSTPWRNRRFQKPPDTTLSGGGRYTYSRPQWGVPFHLNKPMKSKSVTPLFTSKKLDETREFYTKHLGFEITMDNEMYLGLRLGEGGPELGFMPEGCESWLSSGEGIFYCFNVDDVEAEYRALVAGGAKISDPPQDMPWGERRLTLDDPNGITIYLGQRIAEPVDCAN